MIIYSIHLSAKQSDLLIFSMDFFRERIKKFAAHLKIALGYVKNKSPLVLTAG
jgi:hypothetical protein